GEPQPVRRCAAAHDAQRRAPLPRRQPTRRHCAPPGRQGARPRGRPGVSVARRREGGRRTGAGPPADRRARGPPDRTERRGVRRAGGGAGPGVPRRGRSVLALGFVVYAAAWIFGSKPLYPVAIGLLAVSLLSWLWVRVAKGPFRFHRRTRESYVYEGEDVAMR